MAIKEKIISLICPVVHLENLELVLTTLLNQNCEENFEVIFINDALEPEKGKIRLLFTTTVGCNNRFCYHETSGSGNCLSRNMGAKLARAETLIFADGDQLFSPNFVSAHLKLHQHFYGKIIGIGICNIDLSLDGKIWILWTPDKDAANYYLWNREPKPLNQDPINFVRGLNPEKARRLAMWHEPSDLSNYVNLVGRNFSIKKKDFLEIGGFDPDLNFSPFSISRGWEDLGLGLKAKENGFCFYSSDCWAVHLGHSFLRKDSGLRNLRKIIEKFPWFAKQRPEWFERRGMTGLIKDELAKIIF